ncbi:LexA family protein [Parapedobacter koreensis]|uniref:SOS response UmuD protein. Serine peptidase. MEROPS family S24 n=1 Tax=Parapedobacter koreensis TaxID=332977 RepID=A0A1H7FJR9_9SPHI|nr:translesion error-prone DNA polymerase V autoproteolytic subunit [Parapedobacter koreensis]SEK24672.1 SOS response UmuD protein. Serine peptidase. MEROPS family S24 [Parapedobacter koreensis]
MDVVLYKRGRSRSLIPLFGERIHAGFESPATDYEEEKIDLNDYVTSYPEATFYAKVTGDCMEGSGIHDGDLLVVNRSLTPANGDVVVGVMDGDFILRAYLMHRNVEYLMPDNPAYRPIKRTETTQFTVWGVVQHTIHNQHRRKDVRADRLQQLLR